jgi:hypothetical protein
METKTFAQVVILKAITKKVCNYEIQPFSLYQEADGWSGDWEESSPYSEAPYNDCSSPSPYSDDA